MIDDPLDIGLLSSTPAPVAAVIADSVCSRSGRRLVTVEVRHHRFVLAEFNTHSHAKNSASTRARPTRGIIAELIADIAYPVEFGINMPGMQAGEALTGQAHVDAVLAWTRGALRAIETSLELIASPDIVAETLISHRSRSLVDLGGATALVPSLRQRISANDVVARLLERRRDVVRFVDDVFAAVEQAVASGRPGLLNVHKQIAGRPLEPYAWHVSVHTAHLEGAGSSWENMIAQRCTPASGKRLAQPEFAVAADEIRAAIEASTPQVLSAGEWHLPYLRPADIAELDLDGRISVATARVARTSFVAQHGTRDLVEDLALFARLALARPPHWSPFEQVATPLPGATTGRIPDWQPLRHSPKRLLERLISSAFDRIPDDVAARHGLVRPVPV